jgi:amidophosphoribosyltransferase
VAREQGITYAEGLLTNAYASIATGFRTFIRPTGRDAAAVLKYSVVEPMVRGKDLIVVDDSVVRGSFRHVAAKLRACGARSIHLRIASPPLRAGCYYGVDFGDGELLANQVPDHEERMRWLGVDSLVHLSWDEVVQAAVDVPLDGGHGAPNVFLQHGFCGACFTREYPTGVIGTIARERSVDSAAESLPDPQGGTHRLPRSGASRPS